MKTTSTSPPMRSTASCCGTTRPYTSIASFPGMKERTVIVDGFSKTYAMTGMRLAWAAAPEEVIVVMTEAAGNVLSSVNEGCAVGRRGRAERQSGCVEEMKRQYRRRREIIVGGLNDMKGVSCLMPGGASYAFPNISPAGYSSREFAMRLLEGEARGGRPRHRLPARAARASSVWRMPPARTTSARALKRIREFVETLS